MTNSELEARQVKLERQEGIKVLLTDAEVWPEHKSGAKYQTKLWPKFRGTPITVGRPRKPLPGWTCGTDLVWPVIDQTIIKQIHGAESYRHYVCRHQIQAGD